MEHKELRTKELSEAYEIKEIALNPVYVTDNYLEIIKNQGFNVRWMEASESSDKDILTLLVEVN